MKEAITEVQSADVTQTCWHIPNSKHEWMKSVVSNNAIGFHTRHNGISVSTIVLYHSKTFLSERSRRNLETVAAVLMIIQEEMTKTANHSEERLKRA
jgi:hypothetical protein